MNKTNDVLIAGSGMAGLMAALAAASRGASVAVVSEGMGCLAISGGNIDLLGYDAKGALLDDPWEGIKSLPNDHPYSLLGEDNIKSALAELCECLAAQGLPMHSAVDAQGKKRNFRLPTIMGTLKPTWLFQEDFNPEKIEGAHKILVITVKGFRDFRSRLIISQLRRYPGWGDKEYDAIVLPEPFKEKGRSLNALDLAHVGDRRQGRDWFLNIIKDKGKGYDLALIPPMLGVKANSSIRESFPKALGCDCLELLSIPPGVAGMRLRHALMGKLHELGVEFFENATVSHAEVKNNICKSITLTGAGREFIHKPKAVIVATGGIINGGIILGEGTAREAIFNLPLDVPANVDDWTDPQIYGSHLLARLGISVDSSMQAIPKDGSGKLENVFFAGRVIGGYDYAAEKSGHGVACATGWKAGVMAAQTARGPAPETRPNGV